MEQKKKVELTDNKASYKIPKWGEEGLLTNQDTFFKPEKTHSKEYKTENSAEQTKDVHEFAKGFSIMSENKSLSPTDPIFTPTSEARGSRSGTAAGEVATLHLSYIFTLTPKLKKFVDVEEDLSKLIPYPNYVDMTLWRKLAPYNYVYNPLAYKGLPEDGSNCIYLFTGDRFPGDFIQPNTFFRFSDLQERLCGSPSKRRDLFARDWLVALAYMKPEKRDRYDLQKGFLPTEKDLADVRKYLETTKHHSHFPIWNSAGVLHTPLESAQFLATLFARSATSLSEPKPASNVASFTFGRFCQLAHAATLSPKSGWNVMARYWNVSIPQEIQFYYLPPDRIQRRLKGEDMKEWEDIIKKGHEATWDAMNDNEEQPKKFLPKRGVVYALNLGLKLLVEDDYYKLGTHPQGLYTVYVSREDWKAMQAEGVTIRPDAWTWPLEWEPPTTLKVPPSRDSIDTIEAWVTEDRIEVASIWGRRTGQNQVMGGASAPKDIWPIVPHGETARDFEWLHRIAFSFGGTGKEGDPDTAQDANNLVFGTAEANTTMMRYEAYIRRLAGREEIKDVHVVTKLPYSGKAYWTAPFLRYAWEPTFRDGTPGNQRAVDFSLTGRGRPTTFEVMMDEQVEKLIEKGSKLYNVLYHYVYDAREKVNDVDEKVPWF